MHEHTQNTQTRKKHPFIKPGPRPTRETEILQLIVLLDLRAVVLSREDLGDGEPERVSAEKRGEKSDVRDFESLRTIYSCQRVVQKAVKCQA